MYLLKLQTISTFLANFSSYKVKQCSFVVYQNINQFVNSNKSTEYLVDYRIYIKLNNYLNNQVASP